MNKLIELADTLDSKGLRTEADMLDGIVREMKMIQAAEAVAEQEKKERQTSKKVMKMFKRLKEAAEKICDADIDTRGPYRPLFDKSRMLADEICTLLKDIQFTPEGESEAAEDGTIQNNLADAAGATGVAAAPVLEAPVVPVVEPAPVAEALPLAASLK